jgi:hypothetical protein
LFVFFIINSWIEWTEHAARIREKRNAYRLLEWKPEGKRSLGRTRKYNIKTVLRGIVGDSVEWIHPAQDRDQCSFL